MSFEYLTDPSHGPRWQGVLPGRPEAFFLQKGDGEHAMLFTDLFTVLLSGDETGGQFGVFTMQAPRGQLIPAHNHHGTHEVFYVVDGSVRVYVAGQDGTKRARLLTAGDFGFVPAGLVHAYQVEEPSQVLGVATGGFERFFQQMGQPTDHAAPGQPPFIPDFPRMQAAAQRHDMEFRPDYDWSDAQS
jgi:quercetin 2,3-dioxygenase